MNCYVLNAYGNPVQETNLVRWSLWYASADRSLAQDRIGDVRISTVFLGADHRFGETGPPLLYETMIFGGPDDGYQERTSNRHAALAAHDRACAVFRDSGV